MFPEIDAAMTRDELAAATKAVDSRLVALGGGAYAGLGFKLKALKAAGFDDRGPPVSPARLAGKCCSPISLRWSCAALRLTRSPPGKMPSV